ncbi:MAG: histidine kinase [Archangium gephyra]|uniref:Signal transduction histidine-protein kinase/phosphatase MprB n=1 Tax=Archangium gephyra TaxID=48 RepID=A0A2W5T0K3_9BACT|nr:MAG: histidine kinase [Archangium gephyra]
MRLRWTLALAFIALAALQVAVVVPLALRNLSALLGQQQSARVDQLMVAVEAEAQRVQGDVKRSMDELAQSQALEDVARDAARVPPPAHVTNAANALMTPRGLDVLALVDDTGRTLSSGHLPARIGEPDDPLFAVTKKQQGSVVATRVELSGPQGLVTAPALVTARPVDYGERRVWAIGGVLLSEARARDLSKLTGARVDIISDGNQVAHAGDAPAPTLSRSLPVGDVATVKLTFSQADLVATRSEVLRSFIGFAGVGLLLSIIAGFLVSRRITRPVEALTDAAEKIASGTPGVTVDGRHASGELKALIETFNGMTGDLKDATDKLVASERIAAWQEVARRLAHEIKNPLTPIRMSLETLLAASQRGPLDERFHRLFSESARAVLEEVDRLKRIVDEFSQFARLPKPELKAQDLADVVQPIMALYGPHDGITFDVQLERGAHARIDRDQLTQVLVNLLKNAEEAMAGRTGAIHVRVKGGAEAVVEIEDEGPGIPAELKARLFEPYVTTKPQGTGLGLAIAQRIIQEHGGRLEVTDGTSGGALFRVSLPSLSAR